MPENPKGKNPPVPDEFACCGGIVAGSICQFLMSALNKTAMTTYATTPRLRIHKTLLIPADFFKPNAKAKPIINGDPNEKKSKYGDRKSHEIGATALKQFFIVSFAKLSMYKLNPFEILAAPIIYSRIKFHPTMKAKNSPIATYVKM